MIAGGGTGGHIYIGVALARELKRRDSSSEFLFVGTRRGLESRIVPQEGFRLEFIDSAGLKGVSLTRAVRSASARAAGHGAVPPSGARLRAGCRDRVGRLLVRSCAAGFLAAAQTHADRRTERLPRPHQSLARADGGSRGSGAAGPMAGTSGGRAWSQEFRCGRNSAVSRSGNIVPEVLRCWFMAAAREVTL